MIEYITQTRKKLTTDYQRSDNEKLRDKKLLRFLGSLSIILGFLVYFVGYFAYGIPFGAFKSISASANFAGTSYLLPFVMGAMAVFFFQYKGYNLTDTILAKILMTTAIMVAVFQCKEHPCEETINHKISILGLLPECSSVIHTAFAIILFFTLIIWIAFQFTKHSKTEPMDRGKKLRNCCFVVLSLIAFSGLLFFAAHSIFGKTVSHIWLAEVAILIPCGIALLIKSGNYNDKSLRI